MTLILLHEIPMLRGVPLSPRGSCDVCLSPYEYGLRGHVRSVQIDIHSFFVIIND